jgi:hypothetical protein
MDQPAMTAPGGSRAAPVLLALGEAMTGGNGPSTQDSDELAESFNMAYWSVYPWVAGRGDRIDHLSMQASRLRERGREWLTQARAHPWIAPFDRHRQGWVDRGSGTRPARPPSEDAFQSPRGLWPTPGCPKPAPSGLWTSTLLADDSLGPWPEEIRAGNGAPIWQLRFPEAARVLEIRGPEDWRGLVENHPLVISTQRIDLADEYRLPAPLIGVDWVAAARTWDAVRFPLDGLARIAFVELPVTGGVTVWNTDYGFEETLWLRWMVDGVPHKLDQRT